MGKTLCVVCNKRCSGTVLKISGFYLHTLCFKCKKCEKVLSKNNFHLREKAFFCPDDYRLEFSIKCGRCGNSVEGDVLTALGRTFHIFCLRCFVCNRTIEAGEQTVTQNDRFYCIKCVPPQVPSEHITHPLPDEMQQVKMDQKFIYPSSDYDVGNTAASRSFGDHGKKRKPSKSFSLPRRFGDFFRLKKQSSQILQLANSDNAEDPTHAIPQVSSLMNGTEALTINVGEPDIGNSEIETKLDRSRSLNYTVYSGSDLGGSKLQTTEATPTSKTGCYPLTNSPSITGDAQYSIDAALVTPSMINTLSGNASTLIYGSVRRICPPGVDYGRQYPVSYLRLAEQGLTALTSMDHLPSDSLSPNSPTTLNRLPPPGSNAHRISRRDMVHRQHLQQTRTIPTTFQRHLQEPSYTSTAPQHVAEDTLIRPEKDRYSRCRQMSPVTNYERRAISSGRGMTFGPSIGTKKSEPYSSYSTPNVNSKRGIRVLAETMMRSTRVGRSMSPEAALMAQIEARRLAAYPSAKIPDEDSEPVIDRYDWPAPPSPAVVLIDRRREKTLKAATLPGAEISGSVTPTLSPINSRSLAPGQEIESTRINQKLETLKQVTGKSGMSSVVAQYFAEEEKRHRDGSPDLDPISASRSPNASIEPNYSTRFSNHRFASPSRYTINREAQMSSQTGVDVLSTSPITPRPGYTSGFLSTRQENLPHPLNGINTLPVACQAAWSSSFSPAQRKAYASYNSRTLSTNEVNLGLGESRDAAVSLATSGMSVEGLGLTADCTNAGSISYQPRSGTLIGGLPPPAISGLRPIGRKYNCYGTDIPRCRPVISNGLRTPRTLSEGARDSDKLSREIPVRSSKDICDSQYPDVKSWLRPKEEQGERTPKTYSYNQLRISSKLPLSGIDGRYREEYLSSDEFERLFGMTQSSFQRLPEWKKNDIKRRLDLY